MKNPLVSVVIATKNEEKNIQDCLESIKKQAYKNIEIIVVDNNSSDRTKIISRKYTNKVFDFGPERSAQRNYGMLKKAKGKYLIFLDADMRVAGNTILNCVKKIEPAKDIVALYIAEKIAGSGFLSRVRNFERSFYNETAIDGLRFFRREIFEKVQGFDESLYACEDWDLDKRIKKLGKTGFVAGPLSHNESNLSLKNYLNKKAYYSNNFSIYVKKWGSNDPDVKKQFGFYYRFIGVFIENKKWKKIFSHPILTFGMLYLKFLVGLIYLKKKYAGN